MADSLKPRPVRSTDVAARAGVSQATVSRVLSGSTRVAEGTKQRVLDAQRELGYEPNGPAQALKTQRTGTVAVVVADITNPFYPELVQALGEALAAKGQRMLLWNDAAGSDEGGAVASVLQGLADGAVFATAVEGSATLARAAAVGAPIVLVNRAVTSTVFDSVTSDNVTGGRAVARYLHEHGRRPAVITGPRAASTSSERASGFLDWWSNNGEGSTPVVHYRDFSYRCGVEFLQEMFALAEPPDAIFATNDLTAFGVLDEAKRAGVRVPEDLWVVGYDDIGMAGWAVMDLTTVRQPTAEMAAAAVDLLLTRLEDRDRPTEAVRFEGDLVVRGSTDNRPDS